MPTEHCDHCGTAYEWKWEEAFEKFGFGDGDAIVHTDDVIQILTDAGYAVESKLWGFHNEIIISIIRNTDGVQMIPEGTISGYDDPRTYLPEAIITLLDQGIPE